MGNLFSCCVKRQKSIESQKHPTLSIGESEDYFFFNEHENNLVTIYDYSSIDL